MRNEKSKRKFSSGFKMQRGFRIRNWRRSAETPLRGLRIFETQTPTDLRWLKRRVWEFTIYDEEIGQGTSSESRDCEVCRRAGAATRGRRYAGPANFGGFLREFGGFFEVFGAVQVVDFTLNST
jgi:hypothetical protein